MNTQKNYDPQSFWDAKAPAAGKDFESAVCLDDSFANKAIDRLQKRFIRMAFRQINQRMDPKGSKLLDYGCGTGRWVKFLQGFGLHYTGVDISPEMVRIASERYHDIEFSTVGREGPDFEPHAFDIVCSIAVIHHNRYPEQASILQQLANLLKIKGFLVLFESTGERIDPGDSESVLEFPRPGSDWIRTMQALGLEHIWSKSTRYFATRTIMNKLVGENHLNQLTGQIGVYLDPYLGGLLPDRMHTRSTMIFQKIRD